MKPVGFIGLGQMGAPMARRLLDWPGGLVVYDSRKEAMLPFTERGSKAAGSAGEVARSAEVISIMVLDDEQVEQLVTGPQGLLATAAPGTVIAVHSTISDTTAQRLAEAAAGTGVEIVDAPVTGGAAGAAQGRLATMVGASEAAFARCEEPFRRWAELVVHTGGPGSGTRAKLARNLLHFVAFTAAAEAQRLAEAAGIDLVELGKVVRHSDAVTGGPGAIMLRSTTVALAPGDDWYPILTHVRDLGEKDLRLALDLGTRLGVELPLAGYALQHFAEGLGVAERKQEGTR
ncbi:beta-hydroxyacid dehydrogenase, 3-hydroxyisobutyrate dehydrogenase [Saccharomonospora marina XMU15]|uniref:Beta-hydroxyacid dehydrogenase, 3-hydroxyisobutyrate dehydrogenase n=1 Tax=Saccharomonospora marina XMU15 TaxID=882083 RepID=H5XA07_9PSEU|nr:NAD(P)-dependent oxidoreductase [Saccharomonospora marina]EHR53667.1 beta-hydroxyacid dehydrogenase, 3-hydroxyisobutyrate dehydrogenase [Saccharomonospora marina XMU15]